MIMSIDTPEICRVWWNILRINCEPIWFFFAQNNRKYSTQKKFIWRVCLYISPCLKHIWLVAVEKLEPLLSWKLTPKPEISKGKSAWHALLALSNSILKSNILYFRAVGKRILAFLQLFVPHSSAITPQTHSYSLKEAPQTVFIIKAIPFHLI
jgi:hypothetical protein